MDRRCRNSTFIWKTMKNNNKIMKNLKRFNELNESHEISYSDIEELSDEVKKFIKNKGFKLIDDIEFSILLEELLWESIDKDLETEDAIFVAEDGINKLIVSENELNEIN